jgi:hypothetical protein
VFLGEEIVVERAPSANRGAVIDAGSHRRADVHNLMVSDWRVRIWKTKGND